MTPPARTWNEVLDRSVGFADRLREVKASLADQCDWYPYETLSNLDHLRPLFASSAVPFAEMAGSGPILDVGAGDGDLGFLLEHAGFEVHALDNPATNFNGMKGLRTLKRALGSKNEIFEADLDGALNLGSYSLIICLGVLYHLKNPLQVLEAFSASASWCVMSTRVARLAPDGTALEPQPVAYLLDDSELNADDSNYWIFSPAGLRRLARRAGWATLHTSYYGDTATSNPLSLRENDERAFCLLKNRSGLSTVELLAGWHDAEGAGWRWTQRRFSALAHVSAGTGIPLRLAVKMFIPEPLLEQLGPLTLSASAAGRALPPMTIQGPGSCVYQATLEAPERGEESLRLEFELDKAVPPGENDDRELGLIVHDIDISAV